MKRLVSWTASILILLCLASNARAQTQVKLLAPNPLTKEINAIVQGFEQKTGIKVQTTYGTGVGTRKTVQEGGALDVTLLFAPFDEALKTGNVDKKTQTVVARLRLALAVKKGVTSPDISSAAAVKSLLINAKSVATVDPAQGSVGGAAMLALDKMGITDQVKPKLKLFPGGGQVQTAVANGEIEIALGPYLSDMNNPGLNVVGALPPAASTPIDLTGWISTGAPDRKAAKQLLDYFKSKEATPIWEEGKVFPIK